MKTFILVHHEQYYNDVMEREGINPDECHMLLNVAQVVDMLEDEDESQGSVSCPGRGAPGRYERLGPAPQPRHQREADDEDRKAERPRQRKADRQRCDHQDPPDDVAQDLRGAGLDRVAARRRVVDGRTAARGVAARERARAPARCDAAD